MNGPENEAEGSVLILACGALAAELVQLRRANDWGHVRIRCLPAGLHNRPERIPGAVREALRRERRPGERVFVAYADCGTGGALDAVLAEEGIERLPGAHCYAAFAGEARFAGLADAEPGTFYLTDFLVRHFERLVIQGLGLDRHPDLLPVYFGNYRRLVYLAQSRDPKLREAAATAAERLGLPLEVHYTGLDPFAQALGSVGRPGGAGRGQADHRILA